MIVFGNQKEPFEGYYFMVPYMVKLDSRSVIFLCSFQKFNFKIVTIQLFVAGKLGIFWSNKQHPCPNLSYL